VIDVAASPPLPPPRAHPVLLALAAGPQIGFDTHDHCENVGCVGAAIDVGVALRPGLYAMASAIAMDSPDHVGSSGRHAETLGLRIEHASAWAQLGVGVGSGKKAYWIDDYMYGGGIDITAAAALGYDPIVRDTYRLGIQARASTSPDVEHTLVAGVLLGMTWF
jgi:hypothetical protein